MYGKISLSSQNILDSAENHELRLFRYLRKTPWRKSEAMRMREYTNQGLLLDHPSTTHSALQGTISLQSNTNQTGETCQSKSSRIDTFSTRVGDALTLMNISSTTFATMNPVQQRLTLFVNKACTHKVFDGSPQWRFSGGTKDASFSFVWLFRVHCNIHSQQ